MSVKIRMSRGGAKKRPYYKIVVADSRRARDGNFIERVGSYDPMLPKDHEKRVVLNEERIKHWLSVGALPSDRVTKFLFAAGLAEKPAIPEQTKKHLPKAKAQERAKEAEEAKEAAKQAEAEAAAAPAEEAPAEEAPAEEAPAEETPAAETPAADAAPAEEKTEEAPAEAAAEAAPEAAPEEEKPAEAAAPTEEKAEEMAEEGGEEAKKDA